MPQHAQQPEENTQNLEETLHKLTENTEAQNKKGLSNSFVRNIQTQEHALALCEKAMEALAHDYVAQLEAYITAHNPLAALKALEAAEQTWNKEARTIQELDGDGGEKTFLQEMRKQTYAVCERKLTEAQKQTSTAENLALQLGTLSVMDQILEKQGLPTSHPDRQDLATLAQNLK